MLQGVLKAGTALARDDDPARAAAAASAAALEACGTDRAEAALLFVSGPRSDAGRAAAGAAAVLGTQAIAAAAAHGVLGGGAEEEARTAACVLVLSGVEATPFRLEHLAGAEEAGGAELEAALQRSSRPGDLVILLADPVALDLPRLIGSLDEVLPPRALIGLAAAVGPRGPTGLLWCGREIAAGGACGLVLGLDEPARICVSHGCRPITERLYVTRTDGHWIVELEGRPALELYREAAGKLLGSDLPRAGGSLLVALPRGPLPEDFVVRHVTGFAPERQAFALAEPLRSGVFLRFALRDADLAREDLRSSLGVLDAPAAAALYLSCPGRGQRLFRHAGLETATAAQALGATPLVGAFGSSQFGPVSARTEIHTYAAITALLGVENRVGVAGEGIR
jgi:small ligand-binding sensory domain FIST